MLASPGALRQWAVNLVSAQHQIAIFPLLARMNGWEKWLHQPLIQTPGGLFLNLIRLGKKEIEMFSRITLTFNWAPVVQLRLNSEQS